MPLESECHPILLTVGFRTVGMQPCSHLASRKASIPSSMPSLFTRELSFLGRGATHSAGTVFVHVVSCAQLNRVSAVQPCHSPVGRKYSPQVTTEHVVTADYRATTRFLRYESGGNSSSPTSLTTWKRAMQRLSGSRPSSALF